MKSEKIEDTIKEFKLLNVYKDSKCQIENYENAIKDNEYNSVLQLMNDEKYEEAIKVLKSLNGHKDSLQKVNEIENRQIKKSNIGATVFYGNYNDNMEWVVLDKQDNKILLISKYAICKKEYNEKYKDITWENCTLRSWLNNEYINQAFNDKERAAITSTTVVNKDNEKYGTEGGNDTADKVFLLSIDEVNKYFTSDNQRKVTDKSGSAGWWWLRSPGNLSSHAAYVNRAGSVYDHGDSVDDVFYGNGFVRPALWIDLSNLNS